jgi:hypothetical protein
MIVIDLPSKSACVCTAFKCGHIGACNRRPTRDIALGHWTGLITLCAECSRDIRLAESEDRKPISVGALKR